MSVNFPIPIEAKILIKKLGQSQTEALRQKLSDGLLDALANVAKIDIVHTKISPAKQYHKKYQGRIVARQYGYYRPNSKYIYITNRTAGRGQILAPKTFIDTLLHEWLHHYDYCKLKLSRSLHTKGFYSRLKDLKEKTGYFEL